MKRKALLTAVIFCIIAFSDVTSFAEREESLDSVRILGRSVAVNGKAEFNWPMSGIEFEFDGKSASVYVAECTNTSYINASVDGSDTAERIEVSKAGWVKVADGLSDGSHTVKVTRSSEASNGLLAFSQVKTDGTYIKPTLEKARKIEFIGDSYTVGYGNLEYGKDSNVKNAANTDTWRSYAGYASRFLDADANIAAVSGKGVCMNYISPSANSVSTVGNMSEQYKYANPLFSGATNANWNFESYIPQVVVVFLGTNDYSGTNPRGNNPQYFYEQYKNLLKTIRQKYPDAHIFCCAKPSGSYGDYVKKAVDDMNSPKYHFVTITSFKGSGVHSHPYYTEAEKMGRELAENINAVAESYDIWQDGKIPQEKTLLDTADKNVYIGGKSGAENAGEYVTLLLVKNSADDSNIALSDVAYIDETATGENGEYSFLFPFDGDISNYKLMINKNGRNISQTVSEISSVYDAVSVKLDFSSDLALANSESLSEISTVPSKVRASFEIDNYFEDYSGKYTSVVAFYDGTGRLIDTFVDNEKEFDKDVAESTVWYDVPNGAKTAKAFLWTTIYQSMPLCNAQNISFVK